MAHRTSQHLAARRPGPRRRTGVRAVVAGVALAGVAAAGCSSADDAESPSTGVAAPSTAQPTATAAPGTSIGPATTDSTDSTTTTIGTAPDPAVGAASPRPPLPRDVELGPAVDRALDALPADHVPVAWTDLPPRPELRGPLAVNDLLTDAPVIGADQLVGAEDVAVGLDGTAYTGTADGTIWRLPPPTAREDPPVRVATVPGRPLGIDAYDERTLVVASAGAGLVAVDVVAGEAWVLADQVDGELVFFADAPAVAPDGTIYVTEASTRYRSGFPVDFLDGRPNGRLLRYEPASGELAVIADGFYFANGILVAPDESHVLVAESFRFRITRVGLDDPQRDRTPFGPPLINGADNLHWDAQGRVWVGGSNLRDDLVDAVLGSAELRAQLATQSPEEIAGNRAPYGFALVLDQDGEPIASFHDATGTFAGVSAANVVDGHVYFATLTDEGVAVLPLPPELAGA